ncbi:hypothetical protein F5983_36320 [Streptomyces arboris]|uniref:Histidine kinase/HSP90-like ATPase domain-containing protein n=2 Tax=Streptomyces arboris TaxID=2600619 RepID=A0A5N5ENS0_9ACTN|nr:hypothetical protein F5983_36320 [Streptomyces arboris]
MPQSLRARFPALPTYGAVRESARVFGQVQIPPQPSWRHRLAAEGGRAADLGSWRSPGPARGGPGLRRETDLADRGLLHPTQLSRPTGSPARPAPANLSPDALPQPAHPAARAQHTCRDASFTQHPRTPDLLPGPPDVSPATPDPDPTAPLPGSGVSTHQQTHTGGSQRQPSGRHGAGAQRESRISQAARARQLRGQSHPDAPFLRQHPPPQGEVAMKTTIDVTPAPPQNGSSLSSHLPLDQGLHVVRSARRYADEILTSWGMSRVAVEDAVMVVSELVTNACLHTLNGPVGLRLLSQDRQLVIEVTDTCPETTDLSIPWNDTDYDHGRGLAIVCALTCAFGCSRTADGKTVWAQMNT